MEHVKKNLEDLWHGDGVAFLHFLLGWNFLYFCAFPTSLLFHCLSVVLWIDQDPLGGYLFVVSFCYCKQSD